MKIRGIQLLGELKNCNPALLDNEDYLSRTLREGIKLSGMSEVSTYSNKFQPIGVTVVSIIQESHISIHTFPEGSHASVDIFHCSDDPAPLYILLDYIKEQIKATSMKVMEIVRGHNLGINYTNAITNPTHDLDIKYFYKKHIIRKISKFHKIDIIEHPLFGRMLFLNNDLQIAEKDLHRYNDAILSPLKNRKIGEQVAILGGGDGGVLRDLLKLNPGHVTVVEIDEEVITLSKEYLPGVCGKAFAALNVDIIIDNAINFLEEGHLFDTIIYDLTIDAADIQHKDKPSFFDEIFQGIIKSLNPGGILSLQCCSALDEKTFSLVKEIITRAFGNFEYRIVFIPSFCESWVFASAILPG